MGTFLSVASIWNEKVLVYWRLLHPVFFHHAFQTEKRYASVYFFLEKTTRYPKKEDGGMFHDVITIALFVVSFLIFWGFAWFCDRA